MIATGFELVRVTVFAALVTPAITLPKPSDVGETVRGMVPVPVRFTLWGFPVALSAIVTWPVRVPAADGVKTTVNVHVVPAASEAPHVFDWTGNSPTEVIPVMLMGEPVPLVSVTVFAALVVPSACFAKVSEAGETPRLNVPVPLSPTLTAEAP